MFSIRALKRRDGFTLDVAIEAAERGVLGLFGRSGCGKTTLVNIVAGLLEADEAHISIGGTVIEDSSRGARTPPEKREFVADPAQGSKHNRGCAVDLSLFDLETGREVDMPSAYDEMSPRAYPDYTGGSPEARERLDLLRRAMEAEGFIVEPNEWWHFNYKD